MRNKELVTQEYLTLCAQIGDLELALHRLVSQANILNNELMQIKQVEEEVAKSKGEKVEDPAVQRDTALQNMNQALQGPGLK